VNQMYIRRSYIILGEVKMRYICSDLFVYENDNENKREQSIVTLKVLNGVCIICFTIVFYFLPFSPFLPSH
jgi:hypothetical protein